VNQSIDELFIKSMISSSSKLHKRNFNKKKHSKNKNSKINPYKKFLYDTYDESEDEDPLVDPTYIYTETPSDIEDNDDLNSNIMTDDKSKDTLYHELYDIMQDKDVINELKNQNIIIDHDNQSPSIDSNRFIEENKGMLTRSKYHKLLNSDEFLTATEEISSQISSSEKNSSNDRYSLPLRDTLASLSKCKSNESIKSSENPMEKNIKEKWKNNLKKFNIFSHNHHHHRSNDLSLEESSSSSSSGNSGSSGNDGNSNNSNSYASNSNTNDKDNNNDTEEEKMEDPYEFYRRTCVVCFDAQREIVLWPCGCLSVCDDCREMMTFRNYKRCPFLQQ
jgi:hypothetical protein